MGRRSPTPEREMHDGLKVQVVSPLSIASPTSSSSSSGCSGLVQTLLGLILIALLLNLAAHLQDRSDADLRERVLAHQQAQALTQAMSASDRVTAKLGLQVLANKDGRIITDQPATSTPGAPIAHSPPQLATYTLASGVTPLADLTATGARTMITAFASQNTFKELYDFWEPFETHFFKPHRDQFGLGTNLNFTLFYEVFPQDTRKDLKLWLETLKFVHVAGSETENRGLRVFRSPGGSLLHVQPLAMNLPSYIADDFSLTHRLDWMKCGRNKTFSFPYVFYNTVFTYHIMRHPLLEGYDFYMKIDTDIIFKTASPYSLFGDLAEKKCVWSHANIVQAWPNCQWRANAALAAYSSSRGVIAQSLQHGWCSDESLYFYGNFVIGYLGLLRSRENLDFMEYLFNQWTEGYFKHRWTDQAVWPKMVCLFVNAPDVRKDPQICDYSHWRHSIFKHV